MLRPGGVLVSGFDNPVLHMFDYDLMDRTGRIEVKYALPCSDPEILSEDEKQRYRDEGKPFEFSHTLEDQIGGQIAAGFVIAGFYEDHEAPENESLVSKHMPMYIATRALKP